MLFSDPVYLFLFLPLTLAAFYTCARRFGPGAGMAVLAVASILFYSFWNWYFTALFLASILVNYTAAAALVAMDQGRLRARRALLVGCLTFDLAFLGWFKYVAVLPVFAAGAAQGLPSLFSLAIPAGISFYTIQQAVLVHDAYKRADGIERFLGPGGLLRYTVFVSFFPQLVIGPITYLREFGREIGRSDFGRLRRIDLEVGCTLLVIGLFKKLVMADNLAPHADRAFLMVGDGLTGSTLVALFGGLAFFAQLYFDFSGYSDMALGSARLFGVRLPVNFLSPLKATGIVDFYRRWHITLTRVVSRFVYTPLSITAARRLGGRRSGVLMRSAAMLWLPMMLNFLVIALWHGAAWTFALFGLLHGVWYSAEVQLTASKRWKQGVSRLHPRLREMAGRAFFLAAMMLCFALFRSQSLAHFQALLAALCSLQMTGASGFAMREAALWIAAAFAIILLAPNSVEIMRRYRPGYLTWRVPGRTPAVFDRRWRPDAAWAALITVMAVVCLFFMNRQVPFLYLGY